MKYNLSKMCTGVGPGPEDWHDHTKDIIMEKFLVNTVVSHHHRADKDLLSS